MKEIYAKFIKLLEEGHVTMALNLLSEITPIGVASIIFMSQRSAVPEHCRLVADFILGQHGETVAQGAARIWQLSSFSLTKHPFVATPNNGMCSSCGMSRHNAIHKIV